MNRLAKTICLLAMAALLAPGFLSPAPSAAEQKIPEPGLLIDTTNIHDYSDLLSPAMLWTVDRGVKIRVGEYRLVTMPPPFMEATEKYSSQVELSEDRKEIYNHVAGLPFPQIDTNDPTVATKLMFNFNATIRVDDLDLRNFDCDTGAVGKDGHPLTVERHFLIDHIRRMSWYERTEVKPFPVIPENPTRCVTRKRCTH